jgi:xanthine dehydrogenase YagR molybdenum-binding subunit
MNQGNRAVNTVTGKPLDRVDGRQKVTGTAQYAAEYPLQNLAYAVLIDSKIASGSIKSMDLSAAEQAPGVLAILTHINAPKLKAMPGQAAGGIVSETRIPLSDSNIYYVGQAIGVVIADTFERATHAAELVRVDYAQQPPLTDMNRLRNQAVVPKGKVVRRDADTLRGNFERGLSQAQVRVEETYTTPNEHHNPMEPQATTAVWESDRLTIYESTQDIFGTRTTLAAAFGIPEANVRVVCKFVGGSFGSKAFVWSHIPLAALAARYVRRPVKLTLTRPEMFTSVGYRAQTEQRVVLAADAAGKLMAIAHTGISNTCAAAMGEFIEPFTKSTHMMYACPNVKISQRVVLLNKGQPTAMRAPGESSGIYALESAMDELAYKLKLDPIELRLRNYADTNPENDLPWSSKSLKESYQFGAEKFGWSRRNPEPRSMRDGRYLIGMGMASSTYPVVHTPATAVAKIMQDGSVVVQSGTHEMGTGTATALAPIAADRLGVAVERVRVELGDTDLPRAPTSGASRTISSVGTAVAGASEAVRAKVSEIARTDRRSPLFNIPATEITAENGELFVKSDRAQSETYAAILKRNNLKMVEASFDAKFDTANNKHSMHSFGAQFAEVRVDPDLGQIRLTRFVGAFGTGRIMNLKTARSQLIGGITMGIGMALLEETITDNRSGQFVNANLAEYHVPVNADIPAIEAYFVEENDPYVNPIGAKGAGEIGVVGAAAAIANAVYHATGKRVRDLPITLDKLI